MATTGTDVNGDGVPDDINGDGKYNEKELNKLTKAEILELAKTKSYTMTKTEQDAKADIIAEFLTQQAG